MPAQSRQPPAASSQPKAAPVPAAPVVAAAEPSVNRKKAKRRAKEAAKRAAGGNSTEEIASPPLSPPVQNGQLHVPGAFEQSTLDPQGYLHENANIDDWADSEDGELDYNQSVVSTSLRSKSKKKKKSKKTSGSIDGYDTFGGHHSLANSLHPPAPMAPPEPISHNANHIKPIHKSNKDRIWNTSTAEERENIKDFWLSLEETERRSLVKVEKEAVLKKMKEQQKHSCSCSVCGRKRTAIEEELEVLYDAYYEELEQYANHQVVLEDGTVLTGREAAQYYPPLPSARLPPLIGQNGPRSRFHEEADDEDDGAGEEVYSDEEDDGYDDDDYSDEPPQSAVEFFNFGNSLTVQGGILTVADDLLKNDGKKFIEMMEQLAERRMQREEEAQYAAQGLQHPNYVHNHGPPLDDEDQYDDDEYATDDDEYDDEDEEDDEEAVGWLSPGPGLDANDEQEGLTEEQRMEEGRRMFQIFAARMFEQRVLNAYREKVARERQEKLLEELADEENRDAARDEKKAKEAAKKKAKKQAQKQKLDEDKQRKEAERQAAEAAAKAEEERKAEEVRLKREEQKRKKEDEKKRLEEEKQRKEDERRKRQAEARKAQDEADRKQKEQKEKERLKREEAKKKDKEDREVKEREAKERREREAAEKKDRDVRVKAEKQAKKAEQASKVSNQPPATAPSTLRKQSSNQAAVPAQVASNSTFQTNASPSPHLQIATPVIPKAPSPVRPRQASQQGSVQGSHQSSPKSSQVPSGSSATSPSTTQQAPAPNPVQAKSQPPLQMHPHAPQQQGPAHHPIAPPPGMPFPPGGAGMQPNGFPPFVPQGPAAHSRYPPGFDPMHGSHHFGAPYRGYPGPNGMHQMPPGFGNMRPGVSGPPGQSPISATSPHNPAGAFNHPPPAPVGQRAPGHSRQPSASFEKAVDSAPAQPIAPPAQAKRQSASGASGLEASSQQLGSSALLGDDVPEEPLRDVPGRGAPAPFAAPGSNSSSFFQRPFSHNPSPFPTPAVGFGQSPSMSPFNPVAGGPGWGAPSVPFPPFGRQQHNPATLRQLICSSAKNLSSSPHTQQSHRGGFHSIEAITKEVNMMVRQPDQRVSPKELLDLCDTIGNAQNGGGTLVVQGDDVSGYWVKYEEDSMSAPSGRGSIGDIGSPMTSQVQPLHQGPMGGSSGGFMPFGGPGPQQRSAFGQPTRGNFST